MQVSIARRAASFILILLPCLVRAEDVPNEIDEIVVTADYRERALSEFPASATVLDAESVRSLAVQHFEELVNVVPNLNWSGDGHRARYFQIRGVGELEQYQGAPNPSVGFLVDDIDFSGIGTIATLFDVQSIEVLRGSQGSRYGANALAGLVYVRSTAPSAERDGRLQVMAASDDAYSAGAAFGGALGNDDSALFRLSAHHHRSNGHRDNDYLGRDDTNGRNETSIRGRLHLSLFSTFSADFALMYSDIDNGYDAFAIDNSYTMLSDKPGRDAQESVGLSARLQWSGSDIASLTSITAIADSSIDFSFDADWGNEQSWAPVTYDYTSVNDRARRTYSQEFRIVSRDAGRLFDGSTDWLLGLYALRLDDHLLTIDRGDYFDPGFNFADSLPGIPFSSDYTSTNLALFAQLEHSVSDATRVGFGLRVENRSTDYSDTAGLRLGPSETLWGGDLSLSHDLSDTVSSYVTLSRGYKAGGFNLGDVPAELRDFENELMWNLEAGIKSGLLNNTLYLNAALFASRRDNQQVRTSVQLDPGDPTTFRFLTVNTDGSMVGFEVDGRWLVSEAWELYGSLGLLGSEFEPAGRGQAHAPGYTFAMGARYSHSSGLYARVDVSGKDAFYFDVSHDQKSDAYALVNLRLGYNLSEWTAEFWARNLFDEDYAVRGFYFGNEPPDFPDALYVRWGDPRQIGLTLERRF